MSSRTGRRRRTIPGYVSIEIASFRCIAASFKNDAEFGRWVKKAFDDMSIGCILDDTDPRIRAIYTEAFDRMEYEYKRKKEWEERKNKEISENSETQARTESERRPSAHQEKEQNKEKDKPTEPKKPAAVKHAIDDDRGFVTVTDDEEAYLVTKYGKDLEEMVSILSNYKESTGKKYKSDAAALRGWVHDSLMERRAKAERNQPQKSFAQQERERMASSARSLLTDDQIKFYGL